MPGTSIRYSVSHSSKRRHPVPLPSHQMDKHGPPTPSLAASCYVSFSDRVVRYLCRTALCLKVHDRSHRFPPGFLVFDIVDNSKGMRRRRWFVLR